jgi:hypothetical protein
MLEGRIEPATARLEAEAQGRAAPPVDNFVENNQGPNATPQNDGKTNR